MSFTSANRTTAPSKGVPLLRDGDRLTQKEFHRRYEAYPGDTKFELIGGVVYVASPLKRQHGSGHVDLGGVFWLYKNATPGTEALDNTTTILGEESEPQPDLTLRVLPEWGGQSGTTKDDYVEGPAELLAQIAGSTRRLDLGARKLDYERAGVVEYLVVSVKEQELYWFDLKTGESLKPDRKGIFQSKVFPGLWINPQGLFGRAALLLSTLQKGLASREHAAFVKRLQAAHRKRKNA